MIEENKIPQERGAPESREEEQKIETASLWQGMSTRLAFAFGFVTAVAAASILTLIVLLKIFPS